MTKNTKGKIVLTLAAALVVGSVTARAGKKVEMQYNASLFHSTGTMKPLYCETDWDINEARSS